MAKSIPQKAAEEEAINFFPHLPLYSDPTTGLISRLPSSWIPYAQLMRLDRPAGFYAFYFPYLIGLAYASRITPEPPQPMSMLRLALGLVPFNILLRGAACSWNDTVDQDFDRRVERCRHRPVARGAVSTAQAHAFTLAQLAGGVYPLARLAFPARCLPHALAVVALFAVYALMKRVTHYPQVVLGVAFAWAVFFSAAALGVDPLVREGGTLAPTLAPTLALFGANVLWTVTYDTIYAHQDVSDDEKAGVKSMALRFRNSTKALATLLTLAQVVLLVLCGQWAGFHTVYFLGTVGGVMGTMAYYIWDVDLKRPESCGMWFHRQFWLVGTAFTAGFFGEYIMRLVT